nr:uncharacterized protein LOC117276915 [Nicotiana tomentosiformis]
MVSNHRMDINPDKIKAIEDITLVDNVKVVQRMTGHIAALGRIISRSSDKSHRFFSLLKKMNNFSWTPECQQALEELKRYQSRPPLLYTPKADEQLYLYLVVSEVGVSGLLVREDEDPKESRDPGTKAARFSLVEGTLFRRTFDGPLARGLGLGDTEYALREVHEGTCGNNLAIDSLAQKLIRAGYYWTKMEKDAKDFVQKCDDCQRHTPMIHQPGELLHSVLL